MTDSLYLGGDLYRTLVERLIPHAGTGNANQIRLVLGPLAKDRLDQLSSRLANLAPCPVTGIMTDNEVIHALGEHGDIWPRSIWGHVVIAHAEEAAKQRAGMQ